MFVFTHHKCASSWLAFFLKRVCEMNGLSLTRTHLSRAMPEPADIVLLTNVSYEFVRYQLNEGIHIIRNPFDLLVSAYYSHKTTLLTLAFIERSDFYDVALGPFAGLRQWDFTDQRFQTLRMEDLVANVNGILGSHLKKRFGESLILPDPSEFNFERFANGRSPGDTDPLSHYRSGETGAWRKELPPHAVEYVRTHFADLLMKYYPEHLAIASY